MPVFHREPSAAPSAERMRRQRQRRRDGTMLVSLQMPQDVVDDLVSLGWLEADAPPGEAPEALLRMMLQAFTERIRPRR